jgi:hypothetical protein
LKAANASSLNLKGSIKWLSDAWLEIQLGDEGQRASVGVVFPMAVDVINPTMATIEIEKRRKYFSHFLSWCVSDTGLASS